MSIIPNYVPSGFKVINVMLQVKDAQKALEWYNRAFEAEEVMRLTSPDGVIVHAQMKIADHSFMLGEGTPAEGSATIQLYTPDVDAFMEAAEVAGAEVLRKAELQFYGDKSGLIKDLFGQKWLISTHVESMTATEMQNRFNDLFT